jgi:uncharacterized protein (DUF2267 family)
MAIKSVYVDGWKGGANMRIKTVDDFLIEIIQAEGNSAWRDFGNKEEILLAVRAVVDTMRIYVSAEEMDQALATLPRKIQSIFEASTHSG